MIVGVCSWSLQVTSIAELAEQLSLLGPDVAVHIACGDPHHASWNEGDAMPAAALAAGLPMTASMLGFPGEDYTTPQSIQATGGFGPPELRAERLDRLRWALQRTRDLGLSTLTTHAGFIPPPGDAERKPFLDTLGTAAELARAAGVVLAFETGQETADLLRLTLDDLRHPSLKVNFDPANMLLYDMGDPLHAIELLAPDIHSVHAKDARRPATPGPWGEELPLGQGDVGIPAFLHALQKIGYAGPLHVEREAGSKAERTRDIRQGVELLRGLLA